MSSPRQRVGRGLPAATTAHTPRHARGSVEDEVAADAAASLSANLVLLSYVSPSVFVRRHVDLSCIVLPRHTWCTHTSHNPLVRLVLCNATGSGYCGTRSAVPKMQWCPLLALADLFVINRPHTHRLWTLRRSPTGSLRQLRPHTSLSHSAPPSLCRNRALWQPFSSTTLGLEVPVLSSLPCPLKIPAASAKCGCKKCMPSLTAST